MTFLAEELKKIGRPIMIENCHYDKETPLPKGARPDRINRVFPYWKDNITGGQLVGTS
jgi:hypothetical protein